MRACVAGSGLRARPAFRMMASHSDPALLGRVSADGVLRPGAKTPADVHAYHTLLLSILPEE